MSDMDEITYWVYTKRAPCLMNYDNNIKKEFENAHNLKAAHSPAQAPSEATPSPVKIKKRKLSILEESESTENQQHVYFDSSHAKQRTRSNILLHSDESQIDFNIKNSPLQDKSKKSKLPKKNYGTILKNNTVVHKKNNVVITSTPKAANNLRRSLRRAQRILNNNSILDSSLDILSSPKGANNKHNKCLSPIADCDYKKPSKKIKKESESPAKDIRHNSSHAEIKNKKNPLNGQFEDMSDISGLTASYIRSTKVNVSKNLSKLKNNSTRKRLISEPQVNNGKETVVTINKSINTGFPDNPALNISSDSSQNVINFVTRKTNHSSKVSRGTTLLKFVDAKASKGAQEKTVSPDDSFNSNIMSTPRYGLRHRVDSVTQNVINSSKKENSDTRVSRTRSGKSAGLVLRPTDNSVIAVSNSTDFAETQNRNSVNKKDLRQVSCVKKSMDRNRSVKKDSLRERSGYSACFSDSDDDKPLRTQKYFC